jgi:hypothetical protein
MTTIADNRNVQNRGLGQISKTVDKSSNVQARVPHGVRKAHDGEAFFLITTMAVGEEEVKAVLIKTPNSTTRVHFVAEINTPEYGCLVRFLEGVTNAFDEPDDFYNIRRESANTAVNCRRGNRWDRHNKRRYTLHRAP